MPENGPEKKKGYGINHNPPLATAYLIDFVMYDISPPMGGQKHRL
jgi:hypothetical protein